MSVALRVVHVNLYRSGTNLILSTQDRAPSGPRFARGPRCELSPDELSSQWNCPKIVNSRRVYSAQIALRWRQQIKALLLGPLKVVWKQNVHVITSVVRVWTSNWSFSFFVSRKQLAYVRRTTEHRKPLFAFLLCQVHSILYILFLWPQYCCSTYIKSSSPTHALFQVYFLYSSC